MFHRNVFVGLLVVVLLGCGGYEEQEDDWYDFSGTLTGMDSKTDMLTDVPFEIDKNGIQQRVVQVWQSGRYDGQILMRYEASYGQWNGYGAAQGDQKLVITTPVYRMNTQQRFSAEISKPGFFNNIGLNPWQWHQPRLLVFLRVNGQIQKLPTHPYKVAWNPGTMTITYSGVDDQGGAHLNKDLPIFGYYNNYNSQVDVQIFLVPVAWFEPGEFSESRSFSLEISLDQFYGNNQQPSEMQGQPGYGAPTGSACNIYDPNSCGANSGLSCIWRDGGYRCVML